MWNPRWISRVCIDGYTRCAKGSGLAILKRSIAVLEDKTYELRWSCQTKITGNETKRNQSAFWTEWGSWPGITLHTWGWAGFPSRARKKAIGTKRPLSKKQPFILGGEPDSQVGQGRKPLEGKGHFQRSQFKRWAINWHCFRFYRVNVQAQKGMQKFLKGVS